MVSRERADDAGRVTGDPETCIVPEKNKYARRWRRGVAVDIDRRSFLAGASGALFALAALDWRQVARAATQAQQAADSPDAVLSLLTKAQAATIDAIASRIVPTDDLPGAHEAGVVYFVDLALGSFFAPLRESFLEELAAFEADVDATHAGRKFTELAAEAQDTYLRSIDDSRFFARMRECTIFGLLASPKYGGNRDQVGWRIAGFEEAHRFEPPFGHYDRDYTGFEFYPPEDAS